MPLDVEHVPEHEIQDFPPILLAQPGIRTDRASRLDRQFDHRPRRVRAIEPQHAAVPLKFEDMLAPAPQTGLFDGQCEPGARLRMKGELLGLRE